VRPTIRKTSFARAGVDDSKVKAGPGSGIIKGPKRRLIRSGVGHFRRQRSHEEIEVHLYNIDAYTFVQNISGIFDVIVIDFPDPNSEELAKLFSLEFYSLLKNKLTMDGILIQQSSTPARAKEVFLIVGRTMKAAGMECIPIHQFVPTFGDWGWWIAGHRERFSEHTLRKLVTSPGELPDDVRYITRELINSSVLFGKNALKSTNQDINTLLDKRIYYYYEKALADFR